MRVILISIATDSSGSTQTHDTAPRLRVLQRKVAITVAGLPRFFIFPVLGKLLTEVDPCC